MKYFISDIFSVDLWFVILNNLSMNVFHKSSEHISITDDEVMEVDSFIV